VTALAFRGLSLRFHPRSLVVSAAIGAAMLLAAIVSIGTGDFPLSPGEVVATLLGGGDPASQFIVETLRLPRVLTAVLVGGAFGIAGAIFQSVSRNPLGSPDMIGFTTGAVTGAVLVILVFDGTTSQVAGGAIAGALLTAVLIYLLALRGGVQGYRLVLVGIGIALALQSINFYLVARATREDAYEAAHWMIGSVNGRGWEHVWPVFAALAVLVPAALVLTRPMAMLEMGDDAARSLGVNAERSRLGLVFVAVGLTAVAVASTGPIAFVALAAPQIARRLTRSAAPGLIPAALMGALLLVVSDLAAQRLLSVDLPVGVMTGALGGVYLCWVLRSGWRRT
jgi:iron-siderophore transport system permease protein